MARTALAGAFLCFASSTGHGSEGGGSHFVQGTNSDFAAGIFGPAGVYLRNDLFYFQGSAGARPLGGRVALETRLNLWVNTTKLAYQAEGGLFGARYGLAMAIPVVVNARASFTETATGFDPFGSANLGGLGDIYLSPIMLNWRIGEQHHVTLSAGTYAPTGRYSVDRAVNTGRNYWSVDLGVAYTWLHPQRGHEISLNLGYMINTSNNRTSYNSGNMLHLDWLIGQHFSQSFAIGLAGYWYGQVTDDSGRLPLGLNAQGGFRGSGFGMGPAVLWSPHVDNHSVNLIAKWLRDIDSQKRFTGDLAMVSVAFRF